MSRCMTEYKIPYKPRPLQKILHKSLKRFNVIILHRRAGKTVFAINEAIKAALTTPLRAPRALFLAPYRTSAKSIAFDYLKHFSRGIPNVKFNETELRADFPNGGRVQLAGADNFENLRGNYYDLAVVDETGLSKSEAWPSVIRPRLSDRKGRVIFLGTPSGEDNFFYELYTHAQEDPGWFHCLYKASETGIIDDAELADAKKAMSKPMFLQEFECSFTSALQGAVYGEQIDEAADRITSVPWDRSTSVNTAWDLGISDSTTVVFFQECGREIHWIDCLEASGVGLDFFVKKLKEKPYSYNKHLFPHDLAVRELSTGTSRAETLRSLGVTPTISPRTGPTERIHAMRMHFDKFWFDKENFGPALRALKNYRYEWDSKRRVWRSSPRHDWASHFADAAGLAAENIRVVRPRSQPFKQPEQTWVV